MVVGSYDNVLSEPNSECLRTSELGVDIAEANALCSDLGLDASYIYIYICVCIYRGPYFSKPDFNRRHSDAQNDASHKSRMSPTISHLCLWTKIVYARGRFKDV